MINCSLVTLQVSECTINQRVSENIPQVSDPPPSNQLVSETTPLQTRYQCQRSHTFTEIIGRGQSIFCSGLPHSTPSSSWGESTSDPVNPERHTSNGRDHLSVQSDICRQNQPIQAELEGPNSGDLTVTEGYQIPLISTPNQHSPPFSPHLSPENTAIMEAEAGYFPNSNCHRGILFEHVHCPKERWGSETCHQSKAVEQVCEVRALQDGGPSHSQSPPEETRLDGKSGPERCIFHGSSSPSISAVPPLQVGEEDIPVQLSPLWLVHSSESIHEDTQTSCGNAQITKHSTGNLHGRHASDGRLQTEASRTYPVDIIPSREPGVHRQQQEVHLATHSGNRVSWDDCKLPINGPKITRRENQENQTRGATLVAAKATISLFTIPVSRKAKCHLSSSTNGSPILSLTPDLPKTSSDRQPTELPSSSTTVSPGTGGSSVVGAPPLLLEWKKPDHPVNFLDNNIGCLSTGLGGHLQWQSDQRTMVSTRAVPPHQLPGAASSHLGSTDLCKREIRHFHPPTNRQLNSSRLYQQEGGTVSPKLSQLTKDLWLWCMERNILLHAQHLPGILNTIADEESRTWSDRSEWKLSPILFQEINRLLGPLSTDLFASRLSSQLPVFVRWKPDPLAVATDAFTQDWNSLPGKLYANPPWGLIGRVLSLVHTQGVQELVLVAPVWKAQPWYPMLLQMLVRAPILIPQSPDTIQPVCQNNLPDIIPQLAVWAISANSVKAATFLKQLQILSSHHGGTD